MVTGSPNPRSRRLGAGRFVAAGLALVVVVGGLLWWSWRTPLISPHAAGQVAAEDLEPGRSRAPTVAAGTTRVARQVVADRGLVVVRLTDESGAPLAGVDVQGFAEGLRDGDLVQPAVDTDGDGRAVLELEPGNYLICGNGRRERLPDRTQAFVEVTARAGVETECVLVLDALDASLDVQVLDDSGAPVRGVDLHVADWERTAVTDAAGRATLQRLPARSVSLRIGAAPGSVAVPYGFVRHVELRARAAGSVTIRLERSGSMRVRVALPTGAVPGGSRGTVAALGPDHRYPTAFAERSVELPGEVRFESLPPGSYGLRLTLPSDLPFVPDAPATAEVEPGKETLVEMAALPATGSLSGTVTGPGGLPVVGLYLFVLVQNGADPSLPPDSKSTTTDAEGRFRFLGLPQRELSLNVQVWSHPAEHLRFVGTCDQPSLVTWPMEGFDLRLLRGFGIRGVVRTKSGRAVRGGSVKIDRALFAGEDERFLDGDRDGAFEFRHLRPGRYRLWYEDEQHERASAVRDVEVGVRADDPEFVEVGLTVGSSR